jgi:hypothetical protein
MDESDLTDTPNSFVVINDETRPDLLCTCYSIGSYHYLSFHSGRTIPPAMRSYLTTSLGYIFRPACLVVSRQTCRPITEPQFEYVWQLRTAVRYYKLDVSSVVTDTFYPNFPLWR